MRPHWCGADDWPRVEAALQLSSVGGMKPAGIWQPHFPTRASPIVCREQVQRALARLKQSESQKTPQEEQEQQQHEGDIETCFIRDMMIAVLLLEAATSKVQFGIQEGVLDTAVPQHVLTGTQIARS